MKPFSMKKVIEKVKSGYEKLSKFHKSKEGQKISKAAVKAGVGFLKESGLGQKGVDKLNKIAEKHTKNNAGLDNLRQFAHMNASSYFKEKETLPSPSMSSVVGSPTGVRLNHPKCGKATKTAFS